MNHGAIKMKVKQVKNINVVKKRGPTTRFELASFLKRPSPIPSRTDPMMIMCILVSSYLNVSMCVVITTALRYHDSKRHTPAMTNARRRISQNQSIFSSRFH